MLPFLTSVLVYGAYALICICITSTIIYILYPPILSDIGLLQRVVRTELEKKRCINSSYTLVDSYEKHVHIQGSKTFLYFMNEQYSYLDVNIQANRIMNYFVRNKIIRIRDVVCLLMNNEPAFVWAWLAIAKCGATTALINNNLRGKSLLHCIKISESKTIICGCDFIETLEELKPELDELGIRIFVTGCSDELLPPGFSDLTSLSLDSPDTNNREARTGVDFINDVAVYIYTSGTTGLPKATKMTYLRLFRVSTLLSIYDTGPDDIVYICLPLYHGAAFGIGLMNVIRTGSSAVIKKKFSVREFWHDVRQYRVTVIQYIGEIVRYLVQAPRANQDGVYPHGPIKVAVGNGLPVDIWNEFQQRFNIRRIGEYYAASEGNVVLLNLDGKEGTVGRYTPLFKKMLENLEIIVCDIETAEPVRGADGMCMLCPRGNPGLFATKINENFPLDGYVGEKKITEKKIIRDVLQKGDAYFNTGDLMVIDEDGYVFFKDRLGNTFRWKGENVATTEVELTLLEYQQIESANVYGVGIKGKDGKAGMASIVIENNATLDCLALYKHATECLPNYACPKIVRVKESLEVTGTFKLRKVNLIKEGFDPKHITDPLYYMNDEKKTYSVLDEEAYNDVLSGIIRI